MSVMVVGGCGYIGAHVVRVLQERQKEVVVVDDLSYGDAARIGSARLVQMDVADAGNYGRLVEALDGVTAVIHFAARKQVGESMEKPAWYYQQNIGGLALVLQAMAEKGVDQMIFQFFRGGLRDAGCRAGQRRYRQASDQSLRGNQAVRGNHDGGLPASLRLEVDWAAVL